MRYTIFIVSEQNYFHCFRTELYPFINDHLWCNCNWSMCIKL